MLEIIAFLEAEFGIRVGDEETVPENLESIPRIAAFVDRKLAAGRRRRCCRRAEPRLPARPLEVLMIATSLDRVRFVTSNLGVRTPALYALKRIAWVDHFFHLTAPLARVRFPRLRTDLRFAQATADDFAEIERGLPALDAESRRSS